MNEAVIYIGLAQSLFAAILVLQKKNLHIADRILSCWLLVIACSFALNLVEAYYNIEDAGIWPISLSFVFTFPPFLFLYSKYATIEFNRFNPYDLLHVCLPVLVTWILLAVFKNTSDNDFLSLVHHYNENKFLRSLLGTFFVINLWVYSLLALRNINQYKRKINDLYSYKSDIISLTWLRVLTISFLIVYNIIIIVTSFENSEYYSNIEVLRKVTLLMFVYILSIWGFKQIQLNSDLKPQKEEEVPTSITSKINTSGKYQKSGLKDSQANEYLQQLVEYMNQSEIWKDNELSVAKLSQLTNIPKQYITQVLNENLQKNFYTFVNEYRVEYAKKMIKSPDYKAWSFLAIGYECGFNSKTTFNVFFKKYTGKTPSEYKNS